MSTLAESCDFISDKYEDLKDSVKLLEDANKLQVTTNKDHADECVLLKKAIDDLKNELEQEKRNNNDQHQYYRTCFHLKLCGVPLQPGEDEQLDTPSNHHTVQAIKDICTAADINLIEGSIDVTHRLGQESHSPIIIRFATRFHF